MDVAVPIYKVGNPLTRKYMIEKKHLWAIKKTMRGGPCPFLLNNKCIIHETRPQICRDYPQDSYCIREQMEKAQEKDKFRNGN
jgi:Fe-S-cluster containining protein